MKRILSYITSFTVIGTPFIALAQSVVQYRPAANITDIGGVNSYIVAITTFAGGVILALAVLMIIISAYYFLTAGGSEDNVKTARTYLIYALVGIAVALLAFALPSLTASIFGK